MYQTNAHHQGIQKVFMVNGKTLRQERANNSLFYFLQSSQEQVDETRSADEGGDDAYGDFSGGQDGAGEGIAEDEEGAASEEGGG